MTSRFGSLLTLSSKYSGSKRFTSIIPLSHRAMLIHHHVDATNLERFIWSAAGPSLCQIWFRTFIKLYNSSCQCLTKKNQQAFKQQQYFVHFRNFIIQVHETWAPFDIQHTDWYFKYSNLLPHDNPLLPSMLRQRLSGHLIKDFDEFLTQDFFIMFNANKVGGAEVIGRVNGPYERDQVPSRLDDSGDLLAPFRAPDWGYGYEEPEISITSDEFLVYKHVLWHTYNHRQGQIYLQPGTGAWKSLPVPKRLRQEGKHWLAKFFVRCWWYMGKREI